MQKYLWWFLVQMKSLEFAFEINRPLKLYRMDPTNFCLAEAEAATTTTISMTSLLTQTVPYSTRLSSMPKANNKFLKKVFKSCRQLSKSWLWKSIFYVKNYRNLSSFFFIEEYYLKVNFLLLTFFENFNSKPKPFIYRKVESSSRYDLVDLIYSW